MGLEQIVDVKITRQTVVPTRVGFGTCAYLSALATLTEPAEYFKLSEVEAASDDVGADSIAFATAYFGQEIAPTKLVIIPDSGASITESLNTAVDANNDWYALACATDAAADLQEIAGWVQGKSNENPKLFFAKTSDGAVLTSETTDPASVIKDAGQDRTSVFYKANTDEVVGAILGRVLPLDPGSVQWAFKSLASVTADDFSGSELSNAFSKNANVYQSIGGISMTNQGKTAGEWIDVMRGIDWLKATITTNLFTYMINEPKVSYTDKYIGVIKSNVLESLNEAVAQGVLQGQPVVTAPSAASVSASDKAARILPDVKFTGVLAGAIIKVEIEGTVTL